MTRIQKLRFRYFMLSFAVTFLILSLFLWFLMSMVHPKAPQSLEKRQEEESYQQAESYVPAAADALTVLFIGAQSKEAVAGTYILARFDPVGGSVPIAVFPPQTAVEGASGAETLAEVYRYGGCGYTRDALQSMLGIRIDRYVRFSEDAFIVVADTVGKVEYDLTHEITLEKDGVRMVLHKGRQLLDGKKTAGIIAYNGYDGGEAVRCAMAGQVTAAIVNQRMDIVLSTLADKVFERFINHVDTDLSYPDYENRKSAAQFMARLGQNPAKPLEVTGQFSEEGKRFALSDTCIAALRRGFA